MFIILKEQKMRKAFTLIELMVVVVIVGILISIAIPNFSRINEKARNASVMANMHTIQVEVELFSISKERYPQYISEIILPPNLKNPYSRELPSVQLESEADVPGVVEYKVNETFDFYWITGINGRLQLIDLVLTPSSHIF